MFSLNYEYYSRIEKHYIAFYNQVKAQSFKVPSKDVDRKLPSGRAQQSVMLRFSPLTVLIHDAELISQCFIVLSPDPDTIVPLDSTQQQIIFVSPLKVATQLKFCTSKILNVPFSDVHTMLPFGREQQLFTISICDSKVEMHPNDSISYSFRV